MTFWNVLNSSAVGPFNELAATRVALTKVKLVWLTSCVEVISSWDMIPLSKCGVIAFYGFMLSTRLLTILHDSLSIWALPTAEDYHWQSSITCSGVHISPMKLGALQRRQARCFDFHVSLNVVVDNSFLACFWAWRSGQTAVSWGNFFLWVFLFGLLPLLCVWFAVPLGETQIWLGDLRVVWLICVVCGLLWFACIFGPFGSLYKWCFYCLCSCKDRAKVRHRPYSRKKKCKASAVNLYPSWSFSKTKVPQ